MLTREQIKQIEALHEDGHYMAKFCRNPKAWYYEACQIACGLGLRGGGILRKRILDIGCGFGYFLKACQDLGHTATGIDQLVPMIGKSAAILAVDYRPVKLRARERMPDRFVGYDLVTTFGVNFRHANDQYWDKADYGFLADDIHNRLIPGGRWVLRPNQTEDQTSPISRLMGPDWWREVVGPAAGIRTTEYEVQIQWQ